MSVDFFCSLLFTVLYSIWNFTCSLWSFYSERYTFCIMHHNKHFWHKELCSHPSSRGAPSARSVCLHSTLRIFSPLSQRFARQFTGSSYCLTFFSQVKLYQSLFLSRKFPYGTYIRFTRFGLYSPFSWLFRKRDWLASLQKPRILLNTLSTLKWKLNYQEFENILCYNVLNGKR